MTKLQPTEEQTAVIEAVRGQESLMVKAYAGSAKTTTLVMASQGVKVPALAVAFNRAIAEELRKRLPGNFKVSTMNGLGHAALGKMIDGPLTLDGKKLGKLVSAESKTRKLDLKGDLWRATGQLVSHAMVNGLVPGGGGLVPDDFETWKAIADSLWLSDEEFAYVYELARDVLIENIRLTRTGLISYDDQVYYPTLFGGKFPQFPMMFVDEAQDLSPLNHRMLALAARSDGRTVAAGDPRQSIYGFRGASSDSMGKLESLRPVWKPLGLRTSFRCPELITERMRWHAPGFRSRSGKAGRFKKLKGSGGSNGWTWEDLQRELPSPNSTIAILCRNNGPLLATAFRLIKDGIGPVMLGRDIGKNLVALSEKVHKDPLGSIEQFLGRLREWEEKELGSEPELNPKAESIRDRAACLRAVARAGCRDVGEVRVRLENLFSRQDGRVVLGTIHRAKGLEWDVVVHLDPWRVPGKRAIEAAKLGDPKPLEQERNLLYVCETRTRDVLLHADSDGFEGVSNVGGVDEQLLMEN